MAKDLRIITTGGTFDKLYDEIKGELTFRQSQLPRILQQTRCTLQIELEGPLAIDSLYMNDEQRHEVAQRCLVSEERKIIVIHGTDTMVRTAETVVKTLGDHDRHTVVFTGAMIPYSLENSDAIFNLGCSFSAVQLLPPGVYICMCGKVFSWNNVRKNKEAGIFEELTSSPQ
jgi:L-asparaginase